MSSLSVARASSRLTGRASRRPSLVCFAIRRSAGTPAGQRSSGATVHRSPNLISRMPRSLRRASASERGGRSGRVPGSREASSSPIYLSRRSSRGSARMTQLHSREVGAEEEAHLSPAQLVSLREIEEARAEGVASLADARRAHAEEPGGLGPAEL